IGDLKKYLPNSDRSSTLIVKVRKGYFIHRNYYNDYNAKQKVENDNLQPGFDQYKEKNNRIPYQFEEEVKQFLKKLEFNDVNGGSNYKIGGKQVDASFGASDETYVIVSCTAKAYGNNPRRLEDKINELKSWYNNFLNGLKEHDNLNRYNKIKLVLALKNLDLTPREKNLCDNNPRVYIWDDQFFEYYEDLFNKIGKYAKYELQRELEIRLEDKEIEGLKAIPAIKIVSDSNDTYYLTSLNPYDLLKIIYVARRERGDQTFYQRMIKSDKLKKMAYDIGKSRLHFYNNVILSATDESGIEFTERDKINEHSIGTLKIDSKLRSLWVVDGQHRIYSYAQVKKGNIPRNPSIPATIITNKSEKEQGSIFISINTNQTALSEDYKWDLYTIYDAKEKEKVAALTARHLNELNNFKGLIYIPSLNVKRKRGMIPISKIARTVFEQNKLFYAKFNNNKPNSLYKDDDTPDNNANRIAKFIDDSLSKIKTRNVQLFKFFRDSTGVQIFIKMLFDYVLFYSQNPDDFDQYTNCLCDYVTKSGLFSTDEKIKEREKNLNSREQKNALISQLVNGINEQIEQEGLNLTRLPIKESRSVPAFLEKNLRNFVKNALSESDDDWFTKRIPTDIRTKLIGKNNSVPPENTWDNIDLGSVIKIILMDKNWSEIFEKKFITTGSQFKSKSELDRVLTDFKNIRDAISHGRSIEKIENKYGEIAMQLLKDFLESQGNDEGEDSKRD
ncbi:MAG: DGQHR domain-containing protein, partial [Thermodesulfobium sp.]